MTEAMYCIYSFADLHDTILDNIGYIPEPDENPRATLIGAIRNLCVYVAGADGQLRSEETDAIEAIFWQDVEDTNLEFIRNYQKDNPKHIHTMLKLLEEIITLHADAITHFTPQIATT